MAAQRAVPTVGTKAGEKAAQTAVSLAVWLVVATALKKAVLLTLM